jgi:hypothetical protein
MNEATVMEARLKEEQEEWWAIAKELGPDASAFRVSREQKKRMWSRGTRPATYTEILEAMGSSSPSSAPSASPAP